MLVTGQTGNKHKNQQLEKNSALLLVLFNFFCQSQTFKKRSTVEIQWSGNWYLATIVNKSDIQFKIHLLADGDNHQRDQWINKDKGMIRAVAPNSTPAVTKKTPMENAGGETNRPADKAQAADASNAMSGSLPQLPGTHWVLRSMSKKGETMKEYGIFPTMDFCSSGTWTLGRYSGTNEGGSYMISGNRIIFKHEDGSVWGDYRMTWNANTGIPEFSVGEYTLRMSYKNKLGPCLK